MKIAAQIRSNRKSMGLTQEQVADYLGVSTPAVNKWEKGSTFPDISLLPPLARLLKIDLNTLFSFHEEFTDIEVKNFLKAIAEVQGNDIEAAFQMAKDKIREYPHCDFLVYSVAYTLEAARVLTEMHSTGKKEYEHQILQWYESAAESSEEAIHNAAICKLAEKYIKNADYEKASSLIEGIPETSVDKTALQAEILVQQQSATEAVALLQGKLLQDLNKLYAYLMRLLDIELRDGNSQKAEQIARTTQSMVSLFGLWQYSALVPHLEIALFQKKTRDSLNKINAVFHAAEAQ